MTRVATLPSRTVTLPEPETKKSKHARKKARKVAKKIEQLGYRNTVPTAHPTGEGTGSTKADRTTERRDRRGMNGRCLDIVRSPDFWNACMQLPGNTRPPGTNGRPNDYPTWVMFLISTFSTVYGSRMKTFTEMSDGEDGMWHRIREVAHQHLPEGFDPCPPEPPKEHHFDYWLKCKWKTDKWAKARAAAKRAFQGTAMHLAQGLGHLPSDQPMYYKKPSATQHVSFDGTVWNGPSGQLPDSGHRTDSASGWHNKNGDPDARVFGSKVVFASMRSSDWHGRVMLDYDFVKGPNDISGIGDEGAAIVEMAIRLQGKAPGMRGIIVDGILRGVTISRLAARNLFVTNIPTAKTNPDRATKGVVNDTRTEKHAPVYTYRHTRRNGTECVHYLWGIGGRLHERVLDSEGNYTFITLDVTSVQSRRNADGTYRHYLRTVINCMRQNTIAMVPMYHQPEHGPNINRGEFIRFYPPGTWQFNALYPRRNDTESLHNEAKKAMPRLPAYGQVGQELFALAFCIAYNAVTRAALGRAAAHHPRE